MSEPEKSRPLPKNEYWHKHVEAWHASGLTQKNYCEQAKINFHSFIWWRGRGLKNEPKKLKPKSLVFVPAVIKAPLKEVIPYPSTMLILPNQTKLVLPNNMPTPELLHLVKALGGLS